MAAENCPGCNAALAEDRRPGSYLCADCGGRYVEREALKALGVVLPQGLARKLPRKPRRCAGCDSGMNTLVLTGVTLDRCDDCGSIYFDAGELESIRANRPPPRDLGTPKPLECDGCGKLTPVAELESRDGKALCLACVEADPRNRSTSISDRDFDRARRHASADRTEDATPYHQNYGFNDDASTVGGEIGGTVIDVLLRFFT